MACAVIHESQISSRKTCKCVDTQIGRFIVVALHELSDLCVAGPKSSGGGACALRSNLSCIWDACNDIKQRWINLPFVSRYLWSAPTLRKAESSRSAWIAFLPLHLKPSDFVQLATLAAGAALLPVPRHIAITRNLIREEMKVVGHVVAEVGI